MSAWAPTEGYRQGAGWAREFNSWSREQMINAIQQMLSSQNISNEVRDQLLYHYRSMLTGGYMSPEQINQIGQQVMPWLDQTIADRRGRLDQIGQNWANRQTADSVYDQIGNRFNDQAGDIVRTSDLNQGTITDSFGRAYGRNQDANTRINDAIGSTYGAINRGINDTFGSLRGASSRAGSDLLGATNQAYSGLRDASGETFGGLEGTLDSTYGGLRDQAGRTYGELKGQNESAWTDALGEVERLRPGSELVAARQTRAWAPAVAASAQRLRRLGIGPNDLQGVTAMQSVEGDRARSVDDAMADEMNSFADRKNRLTLGRQESRERLGLGRLGYDTELGTRQQDSRERLRIGNLMNRQGLSEREQGIGRDLVTDALMRDINLGVGQHDRFANASENALQASNAEQVRQLMQATGLDMASAQAIIQNNNQTFDRVTDWRNNQNTADIGRFNANRADLDYGNNLLREQNQEELVRHGLYSDRYGAGQNWANNDYARRDTGAGNLMGLWGGMQGQQNAWANQAQGWGGLASRAAGQAMENDAGRGGWAWNLIASSAPLLSMIPGVGPAMGGLAGGIGGIGSARSGGARGGGGAAGQYGVGGGFNFQPFSQALQQWQANRSLSDPYNSWNQSARSGAVNDLVGGVRGPGMATMPYVGNPPSYGRRGGNQLWRS